MMMLTLIAAVVVTHIHAVVANALLIAHLL
jgi:hypothetical protein